MSRGFGDRRLIKHLFTLRQRQAWSEYDPASVV